MSEPLLRIEGLAAWYGDSQALHGVDMIVRPGETVTLIGRNGAGKTTTLRSIMGVLRKQTGSVSFDGQDISRLSSMHRARAGIGYVPEDRGMFATLTVAENLMLPPVVAAGGFTLEEIYTLFPNLKERADSKGTQLSGGEQQMLAMARILRTGARLFLLDEPSEGLAPVIVQRIGELIGTMQARGMTIILVEQNFRWARKITDRFYLMEHGRIVGEVARNEIDAKIDLVNETLGV